MRNKISDKIGGKFMKNLIPFKDLIPISGKRRGIFEQGFDKKGRPFEKKLDINGIFTKAERLLSGEKKLTIKWPKD